LRFFKSGAALNIKAHLWRCVDLLGILARFRRLVDEVVCSSASGDAPIRPVGVTSKPASPAPVEALHPPRRSGSENKPFYCWGLCPQTPGI
jgi:hypothetical protein